MLFIIIFQKVQSPYQLCLASFLNSTANLKLTKLLTLIISAWSAHPPTNHMVSCLYDHSQTTYSSAFFLAQCVWDVLLRNGRSSEEALEHRSKIRLPIQSEVDQLKQDRRDRSRSLIRSSSRDTLSSSHTSITSKGLWCDRDTSEKVDYSEEICFPTSDDDTERVQWVKEKNTKLFQTS